MSTIPDELLLSRIRREAEVRQAALDDLHDALEKATAAMDKKILAVASKLSAQQAGKAVSSSATAGIILRTQVEPGFALAEQVTKLEAKVDDNENTSAASIEEIRRVTASSTESLAKQTLTLTARFGENEARVRQQLTAQATATTALAQQTSSLQATVGQSQSRLNSIETTYATRGYADTSSSLALSAAAGDATAKVTAESAARALADGRVSGQYALRVAANGQVAGMTVTAADGLSAGSGYTSAPTVTFQNFPNTPGSGASAVAQVSSGKIASITVTSAGSGYTVAPKVLITGGGGSGAAAVATLLGGGVSRVLIESTSEIAFQADSFKIYSEGGNKQPFLLENGVLTLNSGLVVNGSSSTLAGLSTPVNYVGNFNTAPTSPYAVNSVYVNQIDGNSYIKNSSGVWVLFLSKGAKGDSVKGDKGDRGDAGTNGTNGTPGARGSKQFFAAGTAWVTQVAENAITALGLSKVVLDQVTISDGNTFSQTRFWDGSEWKEVTATINGNLIVNGTIGGDKIIAGSSIKTPKITGGTLNLDGESTICSTVKTGIVRVNGGEGSGQGNGGQVDVLGATYNTVNGVAGSVLITPANVETGSVRIRFRDGVDAIHVNKDFKCVIQMGDLLDPIVRRPDFKGAVFNIHPNSSNNLYCGEESGTDGGTYLAMNVGDPPRKIFVRFYSSKP